MPYVHSGRSHAPPGRAGGAAPALMALAMLLTSDQEHRRPAVSPDTPELVVAPVVRTVPVSGTAVHFLTTVIVHSRDTSSNGAVQRSSDIVELSGDLRGYVLYHPRSRFDYAAGTMVNTGTQFFSGTIAGSEPVILHDDRFRFEVDLTTGAVTGEVHLSRSHDMPAEDGWYECDLSVTGIGRTSEGDAISEYRGECTRRGT